MAEHDTRAGRILSMMGVAALACVLLGMSGVREFVAVGAAVMMLAPIVTLAGVAVAAVRAREPFARYAIGTLLVTAAGMLLAW
jgi:hypothetical protein